MADKLVDQVIEKLIDFGFEYLKDQVKEELKSLGQKRPHIQAVINHASSQEQIEHPALNEWLWQLRDAIDEADDLMDEFEYLKLKEEQLMEETKQREALDWFWKRPSKISKVGAERFLKNDPTLNRLEEVVHKLDEVSAGVASFLHLVKEAKQDNQELQLEFYDLMARGNKKETIMKWLRDASNEYEASNEYRSTFYGNISLLSIVGQAGIGRTTLLQHVYNEVKIDEFDLKMWVCVSNNFNMKKVIANMLEYTLKESCYLLTLDALQNSLESVVKSKKFLLVLEDIWEEEDEDLNKSKWKNVLAPMAAGEPGSKILVTTRIKSVAVMLSKIIHKKNEMLTLEGSVFTKDLIGRGKEKKTVMKWLRNPSKEYQTSNYSPTISYRNISLLSIVGQGGIGKTTLLQHVYKEVKIDEFDLKLWVCVSKNSNMKKVIADMLESTKNERNSLTLDALQNSLKYVVESRKFLLVLDDIWEEEDEDLNIRKWENVLAPLASGNLGSKILVTTRKKSVALMLSKVINKEEEILPLEGLKYDKCLQLFYASANVENLINDHPNLMSIAENIVGKLSGSPLAAKIIGGVIDSSLDEGLWKRVLNYDIGSHNDILKLSYIFLPKVLRNCLSFCCTFPHDYHFYKDDLVRMWITLGFIQPPSNQGETSQDLGERYFDILVRRSLIDKFQTRYESYQLHDLIHEMLRLVSAQEYISIVGDTLSDENLLLRNPKNIRHLFVQTSNIDVLRKVEKFKNLHSLHLFYDENSEDDVDALAKIFKTARSIRLVYIDAPKLKQMPKEIGNLIHLRYLKIFNIQNTLHQLPKDMSNLLSLHYLVVPFPGIYEIGKLNSLKELDAFYVQNKDGYRIKELQHMNELRVLRIKFRENLTYAFDYFAALCDKRNLVDLSLEWGFGTSDAVAGFQEEVLDELKPHRNLKRLNINSFKGVRPAIWMNNVDLISNLEDITLADCCDWQTLPPFWQLPSLKYLYLSNMTRVKGFDYTFHGNDKVRVFPSLQVLHIDTLKALKDWFVAKASAYECLFPYLTELHLEDCPDLLELPALPPKLERLEIRNIGWKGSNWLQGIHNYCSILIKDCPNLISLKGHQEMETAEKCQLILSELTINDPSLLLMAPLTSVTSIEKLKIEENDAVISFPFEAEQWFLQVSPSLRDLAFYSFKSLQSLPSSLENLSSLKILSVENVPLLQLLPNMPASLEQLNLVYLKSLQFLPSSLESLPSLKILRVKEVPLLQLLPNVPASLKELKLEALNSLQCLPSTLSFSSLESLYLESIPLLQELSDLPASLCVLFLFRLSKLHCLPSSLPSLKKLVLHYLPQLQELHNLPPSLCELDLSALSMLPSCLPNLSSLQVLYISLCLQLQELPDLPPSLKKLSIWGCDPELKKLYQRDTGSNWHKIAHIPEVIII